MDITGIQQALRTYFDVMHTCDMKGFDEIFHPACSLFTAKDGVLTVRPWAAYRAEMATRLPPAAAAQPRDGEAVLKIECLSPDIGLAQVRVRIHDKVYVDNLNLLRVDGRWMIAAKIYHLCETLAGPGG